MTDKKIVSVTPADGSAVEKMMTNSGRPGFGRRVIYTLEDGSTIPSTVTNERKFKVAARIQSLNEAAARGELFATYGDDGEFWGTKQVFTLGLSQMAPPAPVGLSTAGVVR